jgi:putative transposase-like DNA-binding protein
LKKQSVHVKVDTLHFLFSIASGNPSFKVEVKATPPLSSSPHTTHYRFSARQKEESCMKTVRVYQLTHLAPMLFQRLKEAHMEAARVWNACMQTHQQARLGHTTWPGEQDLRDLVRGRYALHSQSIQAVVRTFVTTIATTRELRKKHPSMRMKYPWREKRFYPVSWPAQAVSKQHGRVILPMGKGHKSLGKKYSRRWQKLQRAKDKQCRRAERRIRDLRHKASRQVIDWLVEQQVGTLFIGNPHGVRNGDQGRHHNQRMTGWEYGKDIDYLTHKAKVAHIMSSTGSERGTSSRCPACGHRHKPTGRTWACRVCGFRGHRDLVGSVNMHRLAFGAQVKFPRSFTYLRPGPSRRSSRADTPQRCLGELTAQPLLAEQVSSETGYPVGVAQKPVFL